MRRALVFDLVLESGWASAFDFRLPCGSHLILRSAVSMATLQRWMALSNRSSCHYLTRYRIVIRSFDVVDAKVRDESISGPSNTQRASFRGLTNTRAPPSHFWARELRLGVFHEYGRIRARFRSTIVVSPANIAAYRVALDFFGVREQCCLEELCQVGP